MSNSSGNSGKNDSESIVMAGPLYVFAENSPNCPDPECGAPPSEHHVEDYDIRWQEGKVVCKCGTFVRDYDAS